MYDPYMRAVESMTTIRMACRYTARKQCATDGHSVMQSPRAIG